MVGGIAVGTALAIYGGYKFNKFIRNKNLEIYRSIGEQKVNEMYTKFETNNIKSYEKALNKGHYDKKYGFRGLGTLDEIDRVNTREVIRRKALQKAVTDDGKIRSIKAPLENDIQRPERYQDQIDRMSDLILNKANKIRNDYANKGYEDSFTTAAKNVYKSRRQTKKAK